jgi:hypothetical protein
LPRRCRTDQHRQYRSRSHRLLQGQQRRLLALFIEAKVYHGDCAQNHPRSRRGCARSRPRAGQYGSLPEVAPRAQEGRDAVCPYETHSQARPASAAGLERGQGRSAADSNCTEPQAARQAALRCPTPSGSNMMNNPQATRKPPNHPSQRTAKAQTEAPRPDRSEFCNTIPP